jgi:hypothetical protein
MAALAGLLIVSVASAGSNGQGKDQSKHDEIVSFWTAERIADAKPRDISRGPGADSKDPAKKPDNPGGGNGNGGGGGKPGGGDSAVKGAEWTGGGVVQGTTGKVLFEMDGGLYVCSGSVVNDGAIAGNSMVLTAGHCVYDEVAKAFATNFMFMPDFDASTTGDALDCPTTPYGCWTATALVTTTAWANRDFNDDYAFAVIGNGGHSGNASLEGEVGTQDIAFGQSHPTSVHLFGYPHAFPYDGTVLTYCSGTDLSDPYGETTFGLKCDMTGGSSGGPWFTDFDAATGKGTLTSVNSYKYNRGKYSSYMFGPYFDDYTLATFTAAKSALGDGLIDDPSP